MRKRFKLKKRSCPMCKPNKMGWTKRWNNNDSSEAEKKFLKLLKELKNPKPPLKVMDYYVDENGEIENQNRI